jgi:predicted nuclease with TOPRIM domain
MSNQDKIQKLQAEKNQLKREEKTLRQLVDLVKNQISGLQVEQLEINNRIQLESGSRSNLTRHIPPSFEEKINVETQSREVNKTKLNLGQSSQVLDQMMRGTFAIEQDEEEDSE